jgi:hypothetical protein
MWGRMVMTTVEDVGWGWFDEDIKGFQRIFFGSIFKRNYEKRLKNL